MYMHVPPVDPRPGESRQIGNGRDELADILRKHDVTAIFASHIHSYLEGNVAGIPLYISGRGGASLERPGAAPHHYLLCSVATDGTLNVQRKQVHCRPNSDLIEYTFRTRFPTFPILFAGVALLLLGILIQARFPRKRNG